MEKSAISGVFRYEIDSNAAPGERPDTSVRPLPDFSPPADTERVEPQPPARRSPPPLPVTVRAARLGDLPGLRSIRTPIRLNQPDALLMPLGVVRSGLGSALPFMRPRPRVFVAHAGGRLVGMAQFEAMLPDQRWVLTMLGAATGVYDAAPVWEELISRSVVAAGLNGVKRLYARVDDQLEIGESLRAVGFAPYAAESVLVARDLPTRRVSAALRRQEPADTWAIHQLYNAAVPRQVQYAEAYTSHRWDLDPRRRRDRIATVSGWLIEEGHYVVAYARVASRGATHVLELVVHPERLELLDELVEGALARIGAQGGRRVFSAVRSYQTEATSALERAGFCPVLEQTLYLKYTTANVRLPVFETVPLHVDVREKLPKRVPTFLHGTPHDKSAT